MSNAYENLLRPGQIGTMKLRNHMIMSPTETQFTSSDGTLTWPEIEYYRRRAKGGAGLIVTHQVQGNTKIDPIDPYPRSARLDDDAFIAMMGELTEAVHAEGAKIAVLLSPGGGAQALGTPYDAGSDGVRFVPNVAPGTIECPVAKKPVRQLTVDEIHNTVKVYGKSCGRAKRAGFDAIFIHAHYGYLIAQFLSPYFNNRTDEYGGSLENRARFLMELIDSCKENVGENFPIVVRLAGDEFIGKDGRTIEETVELAKMLEKAGIAAIDIGAGMMKSMSYISPTIYHEKGVLVPLSKRVKEVVNIPVIIQGRLHDPEMAEQVLSEGNADYIAIGRGWIAEPDLANKIKANDVDGIRRCVSCNHCIGERISNGLTIRCALNAMAGREHQYINGIPEANVKKKVAIIGAGPAGCEAAYRCALRGHEVELYDKEEEICTGDLFHAATVPLNKDILKNIPRFYQNQFHKLPSVKLHLNTEMTQEKLASLDADVIIIATGAEVIIPGIPGTRGNSKIVTAVDLLNGKRKAEGKVVVAGGGQVGVETAHLLREKGFDVSIVEMKSKISEDGEMLTNATLLPIIEASGIKTYVNYSNFPYQKWDSHLENSISLA